MDDNDRGMKRGIIYRYVSKIYGYKREIDKSRERWNDGESMHCGSMLNQY